MPRLGDNARQLIKPARKQALIQLVPKQKVEATETNSKTKATSSISAELIDSVGAAAFVDDDETP